MGLTTSTNGDVSHHYGSYDVWLVKLNGEGELEWEFTLGSGGFEEAGSIIPTSDGGYIVAAATHGTPGGNYDTACNFHGYPGGGFVDAWIVKLDSLRNIEWQQCYGGYYHDGAKDILELDDGYLIAGNTMSNDGDVDGYHGEPGNNDFGQDYWIFKIDFTGNLIWQKCLGGYHDDFTRNILPLSDGNFMLVGRTTSNDGDVIGYHSGITGISGDIWFTKISNQGELLWQYCFGGAGDERIHHGVIQKSDYNYILAIETDTDPWQCGGPMWSDVRIIELDSNVTSINEVSIKETELVSVYPNPASSYLTFYYSNTFVSNEPMDLQIRNVQGQVIHTTRFKANKGVEIIDVRGWQKGIYFYEWKCENKFGYGKFMIVR